ncbi:unnamed protein product [Ranitomeya imitator]|uniref:RRM domain-containing protein n=1 Tax=Ranitomeya imitator TaxID=111125 RepID=A0ABN9MKF2_9NEOB|nr:unnamed protein product [Ranitomeya imitator]
MQAQHVIREGHNMTLFTLYVEKGLRWRAIDFKSQLHTHSKSRSPRQKEKSPLRQPEPNTSPEERDARTVFCMQLAARIRPRDLEDFFSAVGKVRDVRMISDRNSRRSKGIAYVEFVDIQSVSLAIGLTGQRLLGVPIIVQASQAEKNRLAAMASNMQRSNSGPTRLYVGSLHVNITEDMLRGIFEPFGRIENIQLLREPDTGRSKGYGFITFVDAECARRALDQLNGFELAGRAMRVGHVTDREYGNSDVSFLDNDDLERSGIDLGATGRLQLMAKLAEGTGLQIPLAAQAALNLNGGLPFTALNPALSAFNFATQSVSTQSFPLSHFFNPQAITQHGKPMVSFKSTTHPAKNKPSHCHIDGKIRYCSEKGSKKREQFNACNQGKHRVTKRGPALSYPMFTLVTQGPRHRWSLESCLCDSSPATTLRFTYDHGQVISLVVIVDLPQNDGSACAVASITFQ